MKFFILRLATSIVSLTHISESKANQIFCRDSLYVGTTYIQIDMDRNIFSIEKDTYRGGQVKNDHIATGSSRLFYKDENLTIIDLYEDSSKTGTLIAFNKTPTWGTRLEYLNSKLGLMVLLVCGQN